MASEINNSQQHEYTPPRAMRLDAINLGNGTIVWNPCEGLGSSAMDSCNGYGVDASGDCAGHGSNPSVTCTGHGMSDICSHRDPGNPDHHRHH